MSKENEKLLYDFLNTPLDSGDEIFERFAALDGAIWGKGEKPLERYVYIPGTRKDRVVLVAHIDTVWDKSYDKPFSDPHTVEFKDDLFYSGNENCGIGADDRAGCAMLWKMKDCGHSILIVDGEEHGKLGSQYLKKSNKKLFRELNKHCFMIEFDWISTDRCLYNGVDNTKKFKNYIESSTGFVDSEKKGSTDLQILCRKICGVNLGVGYLRHHTNGEVLSLSRWENTYDKISVFLQLPQKRFCSKFLPPYTRIIKGYSKKILSILKILPNKKG